MSNVIEFTAPRDQRVVPPHASTVIAVHDELLPALGPDRWMVKFPDCWVRYVSQSQAERDQLEVDDWICPQTPSAPDRTVLFISNDGSLCEMDRERRIYRNGELALSLPLMAFGTPELGASHQLTLGHRAALLIGAPVAQSGAGSLWRMGIALVPPIVWIYSAPPLPPLPGDLGARWLARAKVKLDAER